MDRIKLTERIEFCARMSGSDPRTIATRLASMIEAERERDRETAGRVSMSLAELGQQLTFANAARRANFLVALSDGSLAEYWRLDILLINMVEYRKGDVSGRRLVAVWQWDDDDRRYVATTEDELRQEQRDHASMMEKMSPPLREQEVADDAAGDTHLSEAATLGKGGAA